MGPTEPAVGVPAEGHGPGRGQAILAIPGWAHPYPLKGRMLPQRAGAPGPHPALLGEPLPSSSRGQGEGVEEDTGKAAVHGFCFHF